jgi:hypothetical protein
MREPPFDIVRCSWPRPVEVRRGRWASKPNWGARQFPSLPEPRWEKVCGEQCWAIDWREVFAGGLKFWSPRATGQMRGFHVVFEVRVNATGKLAVWADDGCIIRRGGKVIHSDREAHAAARSEVEVSAGDRLEVAQWQYNGEWVWGAHLTDERAAHEQTDLLLRHLGAVERRLKEADGPPLKMYFSGQNPLRTALALYSLIINGYSPSEVVVFGEYQWSDQARGLFNTLLPFARVVSTREVLERAASLGGPRLADLATRHWFVMKTCVGLLCPPDEFFFMDDDVFVLGRMDDAVDAFGKYDLVFSPDDDYSDAYLAAWGWLYEKDEPLATGSINTGIYGLRNKLDPRKTAESLTKVPVDSLPGWMWEQGFMACRYGGEPAFKLPTGRYFYPYFDGLPGGLSGYDYRLNPCGFVSVHFGGLAEKPSDMTALALAPDILGRSR